MAGVVILSSVAFDLFRIDYEKSSSSSLVSEAEYSHCGRILIVKIMERHLREP